VIDITAALIAGMAIIGSLPIFWTAWVYRNHQVVPVGRRAFWAMGLGLIMIGAFYATVVIIPDLPIDFLVLWSRVMWTFIILSTISIAGGVLAYRRRGGRP